MPFLPYLSRLLGVLSLTIPLLAAAQTSPPMTDAERARRDAEKVFSFIKFQTVRSKPAAEPGSKPPKPAAPSRERPATASRPADGAATATAAAPVAPATTTTAPAAATPVPAAAAATGTNPGTSPATAEVTAKPSASQPAPAQSAAAVGPAATSTASANPNPEPEPDDDEDEVALQMQNFVAPVLTPEVLATLGAGSRNVKVRFTVEASGAVSKAEAAAGVPRRLAKPATEAILQWRFAPLPQARTVDVEIAFKRD